MSLLLFSFKVCLEALQIFKMISFHVKQLLGLFLLSLAGHALGLQSKSFPKDCGARLLHIGQCLDKMLLIVDEGISAFQTKDMFVESFCLPFNGWAKCALEYRPCLRPFQRSILSLIVHNVKVTQKMLCKSEVNLDETWAHLECLTPDGQPVIDNIKNKVLAVIDYAINGSTVEAFLHRGCCAINTLMDDVVYQLDDYCLPRTGKASGKFLASVITGTFNDVLSMMCGDLPDVHSCKLKLPNETRQLQAILAHPEPAEQDVVVYLLSLMKKLDELTDSSIIV